MLLLSLPCLSLVRSRNLGAFVTQLQSLGPTVFCSFVHMKQLENCLTDSHEIWYRDLLSFVENSNSG
jgi:hypothetical protein